MSICILNTTLLPERDAIKSVIV